MTLVTDAEKIATILTCYGQGGSRGTFGRAKAIDLPGFRWRWKIEVTNGPTVYVRTTVIGWAVSYRGVVREHHDLERAAELALASGYSLAPLH